MASNIKQVSWGGRALLLLAVAIFAAANAVTRRLTDLGAQHPVNGRNPISFCNVLFVGNLAALMMLLLIYGRQLTPGTLRQISIRDWGVLGIVAVLSGALAPALIFGALEQTTVNTVVLIGRIEPPLTLALSVWLLGERVNRWTVAGAVIAFIGVGLTIALQSQTPAMMQMAGMAIGVGELLAIAGAIAIAGSTVISKISLGAIPTSVFNIFRTAIGTVVFFLTVLWLFEPSHFADVFSPFLWQWMLVYGGVIIVGGQLAWFEGLKRSSAAEVSLASAFNPVAGLLAAFLILGEVPTTAQIIGGLVILIGIILSQIGVSQIPTRPSLQEIEGDMGFRGI